MNRYIDADKLVDWCKRTYKTQGTVAGKAHINALLTAVVSFTSADVVEVKHGEWKDRYENKYANHYYECSVCGKPALDRTVYNALGNPRQEQALSPFCPHCGTKMDVESK